MTSQQPSRCPGRLVAAIRAVTRRHADWQQTGELVACVLRRQRGT
jgi:hypothetical protein